MPSYLRAHALSFAFDDARPLFVDLSFQLERGFTGLVGENGSGKTTLLRLLEGELSPASGHLQSDLESHWRVEQQPPSSPDFSSLIAEPAFHRLMGQLDLSLEDADRWPTLSEGEKKRWQIAQALARSPDLLLLDEPSNHLDAQGRAWLIGALSRFRGVGILVSHDRALLDAVTSHTLRLASGTGVLYRGGYSQARLGWEQERHERAEEKLRLRRERDRAAEKLADARREHDSAERSRNIGRRTRGANDSDARGMMRQNLVDWAAGRAGRRVEVLRRSHARAVDHESRVKVTKEVGLESIWLGFEAPARPVLLEHQGRVVGRTSRVRVVGPNGAGKSTLLRRLVEGATIPRDRLLYLPQELAVDHGRQVLEELESMDRGARGRALSLVAALGLDPELARATPAPSPGEVRKLMLGLALGRKAWLLVLDEPTNHLDLPSVERLEGALQRWPGALLLVTHDEQLAAHCTDETWEPPPYEDLVRS